MLLFINSKFCKLLLPNKKNLVWALSLLFVLINCIQSFAQMARPNTFYGYPDATKLYSKKSAFLWVYTSVSGSPINDIGYNFAVGESGLHLKFGSITYPNGLYYDFDVDLDDRNIPTSLDYKNILFSNVNSFISATFKNEIAYLFNSYGVDDPISFWRKQIPSNLIPYEVIGFQSVGKGYIVANNRLYSTSDSATTWQEVRVLPFQSVGFLNSFSSNQILIVHNQDSLKVSFNNGLNFTNTTGISGAIKHLESTNGRLLFATTSNGFYTSNDSGRVWQTMPNIPIGKARYICPINNRNWFLAIDNRLYKSLDSGTTYQHNNVLAPDSINKVKTLGTNGYQVLLKDGRYFFNSTEIGYTGWEPYSDFNHQFFYYSSFGSTYDVHASNSKRITQTICTKLPILNFGSNEPQAFVLNNVGEVSTLGQLNEAAPNLLTNVACMSNKGPRWTKGFNGRIYFNWWRNYPNNTDSSLNTFPGATKLLHLGNKLLVFTPNRVRIPFLQSSNVRTPLDSLPFISSEPLIDMDADTIQNNDTIYCLGASGSIYIQKTTGSIRIATLTPNRTLVAKQLAISAKVNGKVRYVGFLDTANQIYICAVTGTRLKQITSNLNEPVLDFVLTGDSIFVLSTRNRYFVAAFSDTVNTTWLADSIHSSRTFSKLTIDHVWNTSTELGRRNWPYNEFRWASNYGSAILFMGSGNSLISTGTRTYYSTSWLSVDKAKPVAHLNIYPNPTVNKVFRISETGIKHLVLSDLQGRKLATLLPETTDEFTFTVPAFIANGYYLLNGTVSGRAYTGKLMVK